MKPAEARKVAAEADGILWKQNPPAEEWDEGITSLGGHFLQTAWWGNARARVDGIKQERHVAFLDGEPIFAARVELRRLSRIAKIGWVPRGPAFREDPRLGVVHESFCGSLKGKGICAVAEDPYCSVRPPWAGCGVALGRQPATAWVDLRRGREELLTRAHKEFRYGVRAAERSGVTVEVTRAPESAAVLFSLCREVSEKKKFRLPGSEELARALLNSSTTSSVGAQVVMARHAGEPGAAALIVRCGKRVHLVWSAVDRRFSKQRVGEALQWGIIEWALSQGAEWYDLEGIDERGNPGVAYFKRRIGGEAVSFVGKLGFGLNAFGSGLVWAVRVALVNS